MIPPNHRTPLQLSKHPEVKSLHWDASKIGTFLSCWLLLGERCGKHRTGYISEESFDALIIYAKSVQAESLELLKSDLLTTQMNLLTPDELVRDHQQVRLIGWSPAALGIFYSSTLLLGTRSGSQHKALILDKSFKKLKEYAIANYARQRWVG